MVLKQKPTDYEDNICISVFDPEIKVKDASKTDAEHMIELLELQERFGDSFDSRVAENKKKLFARDARIAEQQKIANARLEEIRKNQSTPDFQFPKLFASDRYACLNYIRTLDTKTINEDLLTPIKTRPQHYESILNYKVGEALEMLENEIARRNKPVTLLSKLTNYFHSDQRRKPT